ncbi:MAG: (d)CMP kinase [Aerococcus sp.]|nr:(d)CMP kinase [Aerococcus sp.]
MAIIAIDGPASSGKSTIAKRLAQRLGYIYIDTGAMYRAVTKAALDQNITVDDNQTLNDLLSAIRIRFEQTDTGEQRVFLNDTEVTRDIRSDEVSANVSAISAVPRVREVMVEQQRELVGEATGVVMDGRDIGTVVFPDADMKFFLVASVEERARRRYEENQAKGLSDQSLEGLEKAIAQRDYLDTHREMSPLKPAEDAVRIDSTALTIDDVEAQMVEILKKHKITR